MYNKTKEWAQENGMKLLRKMKSTGWRLRIHENMGWHYSVVCTFPNGYSIKVHQSDNGRRLLNQYWCLFGDMGGLAVWSTDTYSSNPNESVRKQLAACRKYSDEITGNVIALQALVDDMD